MKLPDDPIIFVPKSSRNKLQDNSDLVHEEFAKTIGKVACVLSGKSELLLPKCNSISPNEECDLLCDNISIGGDCVLTGPTVGASVFIPFLVLIEKTMPASVKLGECYISYG